MPTLEDLITKLNGATVFSRLDLAKGYHQLELSEESRDLTSFSTHQGIYRYKRLFFGVSSAAEVFQNALTQLLIDIDKADPLMDDILVFGKNVEEHDAALEATLQRLQEKSLTVREEKCDLYMDEIEFYGAVLSKEGMKPDPKKIKAIVDMEDPQDAKMLKSFLGTAGYLMRFVPDFATIVEPLRKLTRKDATWIWGQEQAAAMKTLKEKLTQVPVLQYFDPQKETRLWVDASPVGLGAVLLQRENSDQDYKAVAFASRTLSQVEERYAQIEKEALAATWACQRFRTYLLGKPFELITDHKPLEQIFRNSKEQRSPRIGRMLMKMQEYACVIKYKPGSENIADYLSRSPVEKTTEKDSREEDLLEANCILYLQDNLPRAVSLQILETECSKDRVISKVTNILETRKNWTVEPDWTNEEVSFFKALEKVHSDLSVVNGLLLKKQNIVVPRSLQHQMIILAHEGHQGLTKTKKLLRSKVWFPNLDTLVDKELSTCTVCQALGSTASNHPLQMTKLPSEAWQEVAVDFFGPLPNRKYLLVIIDEYSRYPVISTVTSTSAVTTIAHLRRIFSLFGFPAKLKSDNGPPFFSKDFSCFMQETGIKHCRITPEWPQANGTVERLMRNIKRILQASKIEGKDWEIELEKWSRNYRATPHCTTGETPFELMFNRQMHVAIPHVSIPSDDSQNPKQEIHARARASDENKKEKAKHYADEKRASQERHLQVGDRVLLKQKRTTKWDSPFDPLPWTVIEVKGTFIIVQRGGRCIGRNISRFKKVREAVGAKKRDEETEEISSFPDEQWATGREQTEQTNVPPPNYQRDNQGEQQEEQLNRQYNFRNRQELRPRSRLIEEIN